LQPADVQLKHTERDIEATEQKLAQTKTDLAASEAAVAKHQAMVHRLQQQQEVQQAKTVWLEEQATTLHGKIAEGRGDKQQGPSPSAGSWAPKPQSAQDITQHPQFVAMQQQLATLQALLAGQGMAVASGISSEGGAGTGGGHKGPIEAAAAADEPDRKK
jgi:hypothetical protein